MPGRTASVVFLGNDNALNATLARIETKLKALSDVADAENEKMAVSSEAAGARLGKAFDEGSTKAGGALHRLGQAGANWGVPFSASLEKVGKQLDDATTKTEKLHTTLAAMGKVTIAAGLGGFAAAAYEGVKGAAELQKQMEMLHTQAGATQGQVGQLTKSVLNMAGSVGTGPQQLAQGMYHVVSSLNATLPAATRASTEMNVLRVAAEGAKVGNANLVDVTNALDAAIVSGIKGVTNYHQAMGALNATVGAGDMTMQDLADAMGSSGLQAIASEAGLSIKDLGAALAVFGDNNVRGAEAGTKLASAIRIMGAPSEAAAKALHAVGLAPLQMANDMRSGGLIKALEDLKAHLTDSGATANEQALIITRAFGGRQAAGVRILLSQLDRLKAKFQDVSDGGKNFGKDYLATTHTLAFQMDQLKATVQSLADKFGMFLIPKLEAAGQAISSVIQWMEKHKAVAEALAGVIGGVLGLAVTVYAYTKAVAFVNATKGMATALGGFATKIAGVVPAILTKLGLIGSTAEASEAEFAVAGEGMVASADTTAAGVDAAIGATGIGLVIVGLGVGVTELATHWKQAMDAIRSVTQSVANFVINKLNDIINLFNNTIGQITGTISKIGSVNLTGGGTPGAGNTFNTPGGGTGKFKAPTNLGGYTGPIGLSHTSFAEALLSRLGAPESKANIDALVGWIQREGNNPNIDKHNPLDTTIGGFGGVSTNSAGVKSFASWLQGLAATAATLKGSNFSAIVASLMSGHGLSGAGVGAELSSWSGGGYSSVAPANVSPGHGPSRALQQYLNGATGKTHAAKTVRELLYANPLPGMTSVGRTDQGVDFSATPGSAVDAIGAGIVTSIISNWYKGQPLIEERLTQGPNKGKYVYYAEQLKSAVHVGQQLLAGQRVGTVAASGTGLELGFGAPGGKTLAAATTGYTEGEITPAGQAFRKFMQAIGTHGIYETVKGGVVTGGGANASYSLSQLTEALTKALVNAGNSLLTKLSNAIQNGTVRTLENALGVSTGGATTGRIFRSIEGIASGSATVPVGGPLSWQQLQSGQVPQTATVLSQVEQGNFGSLSGLTQILARASANSTQGKAFNTEVANLLADGQKQLADRLVAAHKAAMETLAQEMLAQQVLKDAESLQIQATELKDQTTMMANFDADMLNVQKAQYQLVNDQAQAQVTSIRDMTQIVTDEFAGMVQSVQDKAQEMSDAANAVVQGINDQTQVQVDILGERGLFGLSLIAQQLQVQLDQQKAADDQKIAIAQQNLDQVTAQWHAAVQTAQLSLDQVTLQQDALVAQAQAAADLVTIKEDQLIASAQAKMDAVTLHQDVSVVGPAQTAVDLNANAPKAQQDVYNAILKRATGAAGLAEGQAGYTYQGVYDAAQQIITQAGQTVQDAQNTANQVIGNAQQSLATITGEANYYIGLAQSQLTGAQSTAALAEAPISSAQQIASARAQTEFAGSGLVMNFYGVPMDQATAIGNTAAWVGRTVLGLS